MKVLLIEPPFNPNMERSLREYNTIPLGLGSLVGFLEPAGFPVEILDAVPMDWEDISKRIRQSNPDVVGIGTYTHRVNQVRQLCSLVKYINPNILIVLGGHHFDEESSVHFLSKVQEADVIVKGEGEEVLRDLLLAYREQRDFKDIQNIVYREVSGTIKNNEGIAKLSDVNLIPIMPYHVFDDMYKYKGETRAVINSRRIEKFCSEKGIKNYGLQSVLFSKGCLGKCTFCGIFHKNVRYKARNVDDVCREVEILHKEYGYHFIRFATANMGNDRGALIRLCEKLIESDFEILWDCDIRIDCVNEDLIRLMSRAGCYTMFFGVESGSPVVQRKALKVCKRERVLKTAELCRKYDVEPIFSFVSGLPGETIETHMETVGLVYQLGEFQSEIRCKPAMIVPRTLLFEIQAKEMGLNQDYWFTPLDLPIFAAGNFKVDEVKAMAKRIDRWHGFMSPIASRLFKDKKYEKCLIIGNECEEYAITIAEMLRALYPEANIDLLVDSRTEGHFPHIFDKVVPNGIPVKDYDSVFCPLPLRSGTIKGILSYNKYVFAKPCFFVDFQRKRICGLIAFGLSIFSWKSIMRNIIRSIVR